MPRSIQDLPQHPARVLLPPLEVLLDMGFTPKSCLAGTGVSLAQMNNINTRISLEQELRFYRNALDLTGDPTIGLKLGEPFIPQRYGLFGYALLSAETFRHALTITENFGRLTFSFFSFSFGVDGSQAWFSIGEPPPIDQELIDVYMDRDMSAAGVDFTEVLGVGFSIDRVLLPHDGKGFKQKYRDHFDCPIEFGGAEGRFYFSSDLLDKPLPKSDPESSRHLQHQCQMLIAKMTSHGSFVDEVRLLMLARPGYFPDIDALAGKIGMSARTLRRRLKNEGSTFREVLEEIRYGLAREYLANTHLPMDEISLLLGYTEPGNFSHAFKRWSGLSPSLWRQHADSS
ncbi:AraC family transcriptional regulator [Halieaceae bacterium IMCC8485]|uniref:AraC family transcriptional regulator n=1 Tax=Candidatus Seongchinamella marina TaxID=2518990 RepID=A0ABT3SSK7_9GAMM|nr:AraC family transcriptional regulator [Candidatus Seongchinamella marina]MCX2972859.1 AraC family transcriptional regulator [Candidatus Seongchinamella marina]